MFEKFQQHLLGLSLQDIPLRYIRLCFLEFEFLLFLELLSSWEINNALPIINKARVVKNKGLIIINNKS